jgi:hypothetical protein
MVGLAGMEASGYPHHVAKRGVVGCLFQERSHSCALDEAGSA